MTDIKTHQHAHTRLFYKLNRSLDMHWRNTCRLVVDKSEYTKNRRVERIRKELV